MANPEVVKINVVDKVRIKVGTGLTGGHCLRTYENIDILRLSGTDGLTEGSEFKTIGYYKAGDGPMTQVANKFINSKYNTDIGTYGRKGA